MSVTVRIPGPLRKISNGADKVEVEGSDLGSLVAALEAQFPGMKERLVDENGELRYFVNLYLNNEDVRFLDLCTDLGLYLPDASGDLRFDLDRHARDVPPLAPMGGAGAMMHAARRPFKRKRRARIDARVPC